MKLVDTRGQLINWDDMRGWHYHPPGDKFDDNFDQPPPLASDDTDPREGFVFVSIVVEEFF
ncbi:hypothetical protein DL98DRAFT_521781, partial [Cadophora sp. DSE1049]